MSQDQLPIHDLWVRDLPTVASEQSARTSVLAFGEHLLGSIGQVEVVRLQPQAQVPPRVHGDEDEAWALVQGTCAFSWRDGRTGSPTTGQAFELASDRPQLVLAPFGVEFGIKAGASGATLLRLAPHSVDETQQGSNSSPAGT